MSYAIVGFGKIGQALAHSFARKNLSVTVASRRAPEELAPQARAIGPTVTAKSLKEALEADTIILAVPFGEHREIAKALPSWKGKTLIDAMNSFPVPPGELDGLPSSAFVAKSFTGAKVVKGFNHLAAATLATDPIVEGGHRVVFLSCFSDSVSFHQFPRHRREQVIIFVDGLQPFAGKLAFHRESPPVVSCPCVANMPSAWFLPGTGS